MECVLAAFHQFSSNAYVVFHWLHPISIVHTQINKDIDAFDSIPHYLVGSAHEYHATEVIDLKFCDRKGVLISKSMASLM